VAGVYKRFFLPTPTCRLMPLWLFPNHCYKFSGNNWGALLGPAYLSLKSGTDAEKLATALTNTMHKKISGAI